MGSVQNPGWLVILADNTTQYTGDILGIIIYSNIYIYIIIIQEWGIPIHQPVMTGILNTGHGEDPAVQAVKKWWETENPPVLQSPKKIKRQNFMRCFHMWEIHGNSRFVALKYVFCSKFLKVDVFLKQNYKKTRPV